MTLSKLYFYELDNMMEYSKVIFYFVNKTPLSLAISSDNPELVELILSHKEVDVNAKLILKAITFYLIPINIFHLFNFKYFVFIKL